MGAAIQRLYESDGTRKITNSPASASISLVCASFEVIWIVRTSETLAPAEAYAEGKGYAPEYYAFAMNNFKKVAGSEKEMYYWGMQDTDPDTKKVRRLDKDKYLSGGYENQSGVPFWNARKKLSEMTSEMTAEIAAVFKTQIEPERDPTNGSNQWRGGKGSGEMQLNAPSGSKYWHRFFKLKKSYSGQAKIITI